MDQASQLRNIVKMNNEPVGSAKRPSSARVITVTSGKGGVGKSNTSINLAVEFRKMGKRVIIFDADFGLANIEVMFGAVPKNNLSDLIYRGKPLADVITWGPMEIGFISGGCGIAQLSALNMQQIGFLVQNLAQLDSIADVVIVDTGAGISGSVLEFLVASGEVLLVTTPEPTSITDSYSLLKALTRHKSFNSESTKIRMVANRVDNDMEGLSLYQKLNAVVSKYLSLPMDFLGAIPQDELLMKAVLQQNPICIQNPNAKSSKAYAYLAKRLEDSEIPWTPGKKGGMAGFFEKFIVKGR